MENEITKLLAGLVEEANLLEKKLQTSNNPQAYYIGRLDERKDVIEKIKMLLKAMDGE
jgi:hypothetical protein